MATDIKRLRERHKRAKVARERLSALLDECFEFTNPVRERIYPSGSRQVTDRLFDTTAVDASQELAATVLHDLWPTDAKPMEFVPGPDVPAEVRDEAARDLNALASEVIRAVNDSNFRPAALEAMRDWTICDGVLLVEPGTLEHPLEFRALPISEAVLDVGPKGSYDALFRERKMQLGHISVVWPEAVLSAETKRRRIRNPDDEITVVEATWRDWSSSAERWKFCVVAEGEKQAMVEREWEGEGSCPFIAFSYARRGTERIGRGPAQIALPDIKTLNLAVEMLLHHGEMALGGIWTYEDDGVLNPDTVQIAPGTLIPKAPGSAGLENITPRGDFRFAEFLIERLTHRIERTLFVPEFGDLRRTPRSASEVLQRVAHRAMRMSGGTSRLLIEFLFPLVRRVLWIMSRVGGLRVPRIDGRIVQLRPLGPITRAQAQQDIVTFEQFMTVGNQQFGPQPMAIAVDHEKAIPWLGQQFGVPPDLIRTKAERDKLAQAVAGLAETAQQEGLIPDANAA